MRSALAPRLSSGSSSRSTTARAGHSIIFYLRGNNRLRVNTAFAAPLRTLHGGNYNYELTVDAPKNPQRVAAVDLAVGDFVSDAGASRKVHGRSRAYIEAWSCPPLATVPLHGVFEFLEAPSVAVDAGIRCA